MKNFIVTIILGYINPSLLTILSDITFGRLVLVDDLEGLHVLFKEIAKFTLVSQPEV